MSATDHPGDPATLRAAIAAIEAQRPLLGDDTTELALAPLRQLLAQAEGTATEPQLRRAQVTVLFADIVDSTAVASRLDAEDVLAIFGAMLQRAAACVRARGGRVLRYTGDGLKAGFGTQGTREDDAAQAVLAGLDILAAGREHAEWVAREHDVQGFALRVGAHTGEVALGAGFEADNTLTGDTVNIAARMEQAAPPGGLRISAETWAHVRGLFEVETPPPLRVKGIEAPLQTYLVQRANARALRRGARGIEGMPTRMIGREHELGALQAAFTQVVEARCFAAVTVVAEAGVGKSRLLDEFDAWCQGRPERVLHLRGHTTPQTEGQIFGLLRDILSRHLQIADDDGVEAARAKMESGIVPLFIDDDGPDLAQAHAHLLGHLIGIEWRDSRHIAGILDDPRQLRQRAEHAARQWLRRLAAREACPLVLELEDLHWADTESLDFLDELALTHHDVPLLVLSFTRPTLLERRAQWGVQSRHRRMDLAPLGPERSDELTAELLHRLPHIPSLLRELLARAEGNPFYMEELVKVLIDRGAIQTGPAWQVDTERLVLLKLPSTLTGVLQARLDSLPASEKGALQQASIVGTVFWDKALASIDAAATGQLPALVRRRLAVPHQDTTLEGLNEYAFHHQLLQQVTYGTVLKQDRRAGHGKLARWLAALAERRPGDFLGNAATHFELAGDDLNAAEFYARAAEQAGQRSAHDRVLGFVVKALSLVRETHPDQAELRWRLLTVREQSLGLLARREEQAADLEALEQLAEALGDDRRRAEVAWRRSFRAMRMAEWARQDLAARHGMACASRAGDDARRLRALRLLAVALVMQGDVAGGRALALQGLEEARGLGLRVVEAKLLSILAIAAEIQHDLVGGQEMEQHSLQIYREIGDRGNEANSLGNLGDGWLKLGDLARAKHDLVAALQGLNATGDRVAEGAALSNLSALALLQGDSVGARSLALQAQEMAVAAQAREFEVMALLRLGAAEATLGRAQEARQAWARAQALGLEIDSDWRHDASAGLARLALDAGDTAAALEAVTPLLAQVAAGGTLDRAEHPRLVEWTCHQALARAGDPRAHGWLTRAHAALMALADAIGRNSTHAALRHGLLHNIPHHRAIVAAWQASHAQRGSPSRER